LHEWILSAYSLIAWVVIAWFAILPRKLPVTENLCVYFCIVLLMTSVFTTLHINMRRILYSEKLTLYFCIEFANYIIYPLLLLAFVNVIFTARSTAIRIGTTLLTYAALCAVHLTLKLLRIIAFHHWTFVMSMLMFACFMAAAWALEKAFAYLIRKEEAA